MKKLLFGLLLTVGVSGFSFASNLNTSDLEVKTVNQILNGKCRNINN